MRLRSRRIFRRQGSCEGIARVQKPSALIKVNQLCWCRHTPGPCCLASGIEHLFEECCFAVLCNTLQCFVPNAGAFRSKPSSVSITDGGRGATSVLANGVACLRAKIFKLRDLGIIYCCGSFRQFRGTHWT